MKRLSRTILIPLLALAVISLTGCGPKTVTPPVDMTNGANGAGNNLDYPDAPTGFSENDLPLEGSLDDASRSGSGSPYGFEQGFDPDAQPDSYKKAHGRCTPGMDPIYFQFDQARISQDMLSVAEKNATFLQENPAANVTLEGNSDQRGTNEYNMALAERRAINVRDYLINMGVDPSRIRTVSYGEERPLFPEHNEEAYKYNRRVDFVAE